MKHRNYLFVLVVICMVLTLATSAMAEIRSNTLSQSPRAGGFYYETDLGLDDYTAIGIGRTSYLGKKSNVKSDVGDTVGIILSTEDSDRDGVYDGVDQCPNTPAGVDVNGRGCWVVAEFAFDKANITARSADKLDKAVAFMNNNPLLNFEIQGHTCSMGPLSYNQVLSEKRAKAVYDYFITNGIDAPRMSHEGVAFKKPAASNDTLKGRRQNRRVEVLPVK